MSLLTNQFGLMSSLCTKVFLKKMFPLELLSYLPQLFWSKLSYLSDTSTEMKDSTEELQFPHLVGGKEATSTWLRNERLQACKQWPYRSLSIRSGIIRKVLLHCLESSCAQAAPEHNWLCCTHRRVQWLCHFVSSALSRVDCSCHMKLNPCLIPSRYLCSDKR